MILLTYSGILPVDNSPFGRRLKSISVDDIYLQPNLMRLDIAVLALNMLKTSNRLTDTPVGNSLPVYWTEIKASHDHMLTQINVSGDYCFGDVLYETHRHKKTGAPTRKEYYYAPKKRDNSGQVSNKKGRYTRVTKDQRVIEFRLPTTDRSKEPGNGSGKTTSGRRTGKKQALILYIPGQ